MFASSEPDAEPVGAVILQIDANQFLYPMIQSWPTLSRSAETLLVRRDGDLVLFLNELRHQSNTALTLRIPLSQTNVPAVKAVLGTEGVVHGSDYRGVEVLAVLRAIPDSPWLMVAKVDKAEIFTDWRARSLLITGLILGAMVIVGTVGGVVWQRSQKDHYRSLVEAEKARQESETRYQATLLSIGDGVIVTDSSGQVVLLNPVAEALTGWSQGEARGKPLEEVFHIINEETRHPVENPVRRVVREGIIVGLANHTLLISKAGREISIADSGAPTYDVHGSLDGVVLVFRDQTEERTAQQTLMASETRYRRLFEAAKDGILILDAETGKVVDVNPFLLDLLGYSQEEILEKELWEIGSFQDIVASQAAFLELQDKSYIRYADLPLETRDGRRIEVEFVSNVYLANGEKVIQCNIRDVTERKHAAELLRESEARLRTVLENMPVMLDALDENLNIIVWNRECERVTGYSADEISHHPNVSELLYPDPAYRARIQGELVASEDYRGWEWETTCKDGSVRTIAWSNISRQFPVPGWTHWGIGVDITELKRVERQLHKLNEELEQRVEERTAQLNHAKERIEAILNSSSDVMILCRMDGTIEQTNPAFNQVFKYKLDEAFSQPLTMLFVPEHAATIEQSFAAGIETRQPQRLEVVATGHRARDF